MRNDKIIHFFSFLMYYGNMTLFNSIETENKALKEATATLGIATTKLHYTNFAIIGGL